MPPLSPFQVLHQLPLIHRCPVRTVRHNRMQLILRDLAGLRDKLTPMRHRMLRMPRLDHPLRHRPDMRPIPRDRSVLRIRHELHDQTLRTTPQRKREMKVPETRHAVRGLHEEIRSQHIQSNLGILTHPHTPRQLWDFREWFKAIGWIWVFAHDTPFCAHRICFATPGRLQCHDSTILSTA